MTEITTTDFSKFGYRERKITEELLRAWNEQGLPEDFENNEVTIMFNTLSGSVFLTNADFQVAALNDGKLESMYTDKLHRKGRFLDEFSKEELERMGIK